MSERQNDFELLQHFARHGDQPAFATLVRRHVDLVYATALRKSADDGGAQEIVQNVFAALARKAWQFAPDDSLPAWLYKSTLLEAREWLRGELRRRRREQTAAELGTTMKTPEEQSALRALVPLLDEALLSLREKDRTALLLRFYENQSLRDVGVSLGVGEDAAQKRVGSALTKLAEFFRRHGFRTATVAAAAAALQQTAKAAPAAMSVSVAQAAVQLAAPAVGLTGLLSRVASLTKMQTVAACLTLALAPVIWQWQQSSAARNNAATMQSNLAGVQVQAEQFSADIARLRAESMHLDSELAGAEERLARAGKSLGKLEELAARIRSLLTDADYHWPGDLPYVRVPKIVIKNDLLRLREKHAGGAGQDYARLFDPSGAMTDSGLELLGIDSEEKPRVEQALSDYWSGVLDLMAMRAYETNSPGAAAGRVTKTVVIPPLGSDLVGLAQATREQITQQLGAEREEMLFGGWHEGAIQIFWPGNLVKIAYETQHFTVWRDPAATAGGPAYGIEWDCGGPSIGTDGPRALSVFPRDVATRFFVPWLQQADITIPDSMKYFGDRNE